jgi:hypothetical protein
MAPRALIRYGTTETSPASCQSDTEIPLDRRVSTVGTVHPHVELEITYPKSGHPTEFRLFLPPLTRDIALTESQLIDSNLAADALPMDLSIGGLHDPLLHR